MSLFSLIKLCLEGIEEESKPDLIDLIQEDGSISDGTNVESSDSDAVSAELKAHHALRIKHKSILSSPLELDQCRNFQCERHPKSNEDEEILKAAFKNHVFFEDLDESELNEIISGMESIDVVPGTELDIAFLYVIKHGSVLHFSGHNDESKLLSDGELLFDMDFMYRSKSSNHSKIAVVESESKICRLHHSTYRSVLVKHALMTDANIKASLKRVELFKGLTENTINKFADTLTKVTYKAGDRIITKGEIGEIFYIIEEGKVRTHDIGIGDSWMTDVVLEAGDSFGERALITGEPRIANITAITDVTVLVMDRTTFNESIGQLKDRLDSNERLYALRSLSIFSDSDLTDLELERLAGSMVAVCYKAGTKVVKVGEPYPPNLWMIRSGKLLVYGTKSDRIFEMRGGGYFGDKAILNPKKHVSSHDVICETNLSAYLLTRKIIESVGIEISRLGRTSGLVKRKLKTTIQMRDLKKHRVLGHGGFGTVWLCSLRKARGTFALKVINKRKVLRQKQEASILREKELLLMLDHPFILHMEACFQDSFNCYLVLPVIQGGELFSYVSRQVEEGKSLPFVDVSFYALQIIEGLGHFHHRFIAYRDLKLENVMINSDGYIKIVDLGFAKIVIDKSYTICGTPDYMAPEVIMSKGHNCAADYWSFGVLFYELIFGISPFKKRNESQMKLFKRIVTADYHLPVPSGGSVSHLSLIKGLLTRNVATRIGNLKNGHRDVCHHRFFKEVGLDARMLVRKEISPPWIPTVTDPLDSHHFDNFSAFEDETTSFHPKLTASEQSLFESF